MNFKLVSDESRKVSINIDRINAYTSRYRPGTPFDFSITRKKRTVSDPMRRYYWAVVLPLFLEAYGYDPQEDELVHFFLKCKFFKIDPDPHGIYRNVPSVFSNESEVEIKRKQDFVEWLKRLAAQEGVYIPDPGE